MWLCRSCYQGVKATSPSLESGRTLWPTEWGRGDTMRLPSLASKGLAASYSHALGKPTQRRLVHLLEDSRWSRAETILPGKAPGSACQPPGAWLSCPRSPSQAEIYMVSCCLFPLSSFMFSFNVAAGCGTVRRPYLCGLHHWGALPSGFWLVKANGVHCLESQGHFCNILQDRGL